VTPVDQTKFGQGRGNCLAACIASLLDLPLDQVFDIPQGGKDPDYWDIVDRWLAERGLGLAYVNFEGVPADLPPTSRATFRFPWGSHYMAWGPAARGLDHSVIYCRGQLAHDPHPDRSGLIQVKQVAFLVRLT
jgi:hypothetical protein